MKKPTEPPDKPPPTVEEQIAGIAEEIGKARRWIEDAGGVGSFVVEANLALFNFRHSDRYTNPPELEGVVFNLNWNFPLGIADIHATAKDKENTDEQRQPAGPEAY